VSAVARRIVHVVEQTEAPDDRRVGIRQQRKRDLSTLREGPQDLDGVVAEAGDAEAPPAELLELALQLHELDLAVRSPVGGTQEDQDEAVRALEGVEVAEPALLIPRLEPRELLADRRTAG
jgi:hypothetical protein